MGNGRVLLIGYGNPGRRDDGLGPALAAALERREMDGVDVESDYQLCVEDAHTVAAYEVVIFADAAIAGPEPYRFARLEMSAGSGLGSHDVQPGEVLSLAATLFRANPRAYVLAIRGYEFDAFDEGLSPKATANLGEALRFVENMIRAKAYEAEAHAAPARKA